MPQFAYTALRSDSGRECRGTIEAVAGPAAVALLKAQGLYPLELVPASAESPTVAAPARRSTRPSFLCRPPRRRQIMLFTRQLAALLRAGMPLVRALDVLARQQPGTVLGGMIAKMAEVIRGGAGFSQALAAYPRGFDSIYVSLVRAGEAAGNLDGVLERLADLLEKAERMRGKVLAAMTYPLVVLLVAVGVVTALAAFVVPRFRDIFASLLQGQSLPPLTEAVMRGAAWLREYGIAGFVGLILLLAAARWGLRRGPGRRCRDRALLSLPLLGALVIRQATARFARTLGTLLGAGVPLLPALLITRDVVGNATVASALERVHDQVRSGETVAGPVEASRVFPPMVGSMIQVGEETGALPQMLHRIADLYEEEVDRATVALTALLEPCLIVLMAAVVGTIVVALFLPIVRIVQSLS